ncbi:hypothetical protein SteCoe_15759 [Stentor coeruleus]|uniref:FHA domain-containing protein n=1 Tax=Stentor coeruleus TaxID=5963 RepID=A0A1R2C2X4_9CILI|nr:hypothetical protein SteCoe_15759 [Stentor coeruleus]
METVRKFFSHLGRRCCFASDIANNDSLELEDKNKLDITSSQVPKPQLGQEKKEVLLNLVIVESKGMQPGKIYNICPIGLINSDRTKSGDGCLYAGSLYYEDGKIINDILLPQSEKGIGKRHFMIHYKDESYFLKDLGDGMGTFIRLSRPLALQNNYIISFGDSHMIIVIEHNTSPKLILKFIDGPKVDQKFKFMPNESPITIGRMSDCTIRFDDSSLSRYHCLITFNGWWYMQDGDGKKISTNGTWLFAEDFYEVYNGMLFKVGETLMRTDIKK